MFVSGLLGIFFGLFVDSFFIYWMFMTFAIVEKKGTDCVLWLLLVVFL